jgi:choline dehydrogenase-like flavoprotein
LNIPVVINNPAVGANLIDHLLMLNDFNVKDSLDILLRDPSLLGAAMDQWAVKKTGVITDTVANTFGFARLPKRLTDFKERYRSCKWSEVSSLGRHLRDKHSPHVRALLWMVLILPIELLDKLSSSTSFRKFLHYSHCPD